MEDQITIDTLLNLARREYQKKNHQNSMTQYKALLGYLDVMRNTAPIEKKERYTELYGKYFEEYQFVCQEYAKSLSEKTTSAEPTTSYPSPMEQQKSNNEQPENKPQEGNPYVSKEFFNDVISSFSTAGQALRDGFHNLDEKYKFTAQTKAYFDQYSTPKKQEDYVYNPNETNTTSNTDTSYRVGETVANSLNLATTIIGDIINTSLKATSIINSIVNDSLDSLSQAYGDKKEEKSESTSTNETSMPSSMPSTTSDSSFPSPVPTMPPTPNYSTGITPNDLNNSHQE